MLEPSTQVAYVHYFAPVPLDTLVEDYPELKRSVLFGEEYWQDWPGFGALIQIDDMP